MVVAIVEDYFETLHSWHTSKGCALSFDGLHVLPWNLIICASALGKSMSRAGAFFEGDNYVYFHHVPSYSFPQR